MPRDPTKHPVGDDASRRDLDLEPRPKVKRLNRVAILLVAAIGIVVLWVAYFVLSSRAPIGRQEARPPRPSLEQDPAAVERLQRRARPEPEPRPPFARPTPPLVVPPSRPAQPPTRTDPAVLRAQQRLERAYEAAAVLPAFEQAAFQRLYEPAPGESALPSATGGNQLPEGDLDVSAGGDPNLLDRKDAFLRRAREEERSTYLPVNIQTPLSPYEIRQGTLIPAILVAGINSDLPGQTQALVRQNVYDSTTGRHLLVPQGSRLLGSYDNRIAWGQKRVLLAWTRLVFPDGRSLDLRGMPGADLAAMAGVRDQVNNHFVRTFGSAILLSAITAGVQLSQPQESADGGAPSASQIAAAALGQEVGRTTAEVTRRNLNLQPTLQIRPGYLFNVETTADLVLPGPWMQQNAP